VHDYYYPQAGDKQVLYKEGVFVGYRWYEHNGKKPLFPFGYGLSYTRFTYDNLSIADAKTKPWSTEVAFDVTNTGKREGAEVAQVYVSDKHSKLERPAEELKGFVKVNLKPGEKRRVKLMLDERALSYYDVDSKQWRASPGQFEVLVGSSSENIRLRGQLRYAGPGTAAAGWHMSIR
jgi:beta-glucosidase